MKSQFHSIFYVEPCVLYDASFDHGTRNYKYLKHIEVSKY